MKYQSLWHFIKINSMFIRHKKCITMYFLCLFPYIVFAHDNVTILKEYIKNEYLKVYPEMDIENIGLIARSSLDIYGIILLTKSINNTKSNNGYITISYQYNNKTLQENIKYTIQAHIKLYMSSDNIPAKSNFNPNNLTYKVQDFATILSIPATRYEIVQSSARVYIPANSVIYRNKLAKKILVTKDSYVKVLFQADGIEATLSGKAIENGTKGDIIKVENNESKRIISAEIIGEGIVKVQ